jgi:hypothetical protein
LWASGAIRRLPGGQIRWLLIIHAFAVLACFGWLVTFLASAGEMSRSPVPWRPLGALATQLLAGELFRDHRAWIGPLMVIGLWVAIRRGRTMAWLGVGLVCAMFVLGSEASVTVLRLDLLVSAFKNLQFPRYSIALKPILYAFAGIGGATLLARLRELPTRDHPASSSSAVRPAAARLLACVCLAPLLVGIVDDRSRLFPRPVGGVEALEGSPHAAVDAALLETLRAEAEALPDDRPLTVAFLRGSMGGGTYPLFAITDADAKLVMDGHIPAVNYKYQVRRRHPSALRVMGVTHVLWDHPLGRNNDDKTLDSELEVVGEFGVWKLGRLADGELRAGFDVAGKLEPEDVQVTRESATQIRVEVAAGSGVVELPVGPDRKWVATRDDGSEVALEEVPVARGVPGLGLSFSGPGSITLDYRQPERERMAAWVSIVAWLVLLAALGSTRERVLAVRLESERTIRASWILGLATLAVVLVGSYLRQEAKLTKTWQRVLDDHANTGWRLGDRKLAPRLDLVDRGEYRVQRSTTDGCDGTLGKDAMAGCTQADARPRKGMVFRPPYLYRCLYVQVPARGNVEIELTGLQPGDDLAAFFAREGQPFKQLELWMPGADKPVVPTGTQKRYHAYATAADRGDDATIELRNGAQHNQSLCLALAAVSEQ